MFEDDEIELPPEAGKIDEVPFEPDDEWIATASKELQLAAMRRWFTDRYENAANNTPWDGEDKQYVWIWGGPYDPSEELAARFEEFVDEEVLGQLADDLYDEGGDEWAPSERFHEGDYFDYLDYVKLDPKRQFDHRVEEIFDLVTVEASIPTSIRNLLYQMSHAQLISAMEAFLVSSTMKVIGNDDTSLRQFVSKNSDFKQRKLDLTDLFARFDRIRDEVRVYLSEQIWHRLEKIKPIMEQGLGVTFPKIGDLMREIKKRHDIVHRAGHDKDGKPVVVTYEGLCNLRVWLNDFTAELSAQLSAASGRASEHALEI